MLDKKKINAINAKQVREIAKQRLLSAINSLQHAMYDLEVYSDKFDKESTDFERGKVVNYAINHLHCNIQPNLRIELLADSQSELTTLEVSNA
jgi:hypothetical protein